MTLAGCNSACDLVDLLRDEPPLALDDRGAAELALDGYGYRWLRVRARDSLRLA